MADWSNNSGPAPGRLRAPSMRLIRHGLAVALCLFILAPKALAAEREDFIRELARAVSERVDLTPSEKAWLEAGHTVRVRVGEVPPYHFTLRGKLYGISIDYLGVVFAAFGIKHDLIPNAGGSFSQALEGLKTGDMVDLLPTLRPSPEREGLMLFTNTYVSTPWVIFTRVDSPFVGGLGDLNNKTVTVEAGFITAGVLARDYPAIKAVQLPNSRQALEAVALGQADAYMGDLTIGSFIIQRYGYTNIKVAAPSGYPPVAQSMGVRPDWPELASIINKVLDTLTPEETQRIISRTLHIRFEHGVDWRVVEAALGVIVLLVCIIFWCWNRRLKTEIVVRKRAEEELRTNQERLRTQLEYAPDAIMVYDVELGHFVEANSNAEALLGVSREEILQSGPERFYPPDQPDGRPVGQSVREHNEMVMSGKPQSFKRLVRHSSGRLIPCDVRLVRLPAKDKVLIRGSFIDISERIRAEEELESASVMQRQILAHASVGIAVYDGVSGQCVLANQTCADLIGGTVEAILGQNFRAIESWKISGRLAMAEQALAGLVTVRQDVEYVSSYGKHLVLDCSFSAFKIGEKPYLLRVDRDISERKRFENQLRTQLQFLQTLLDAIPTPVYYKDPQGRYMGCNRAFEALRGQCRNDIQGKKLHDLLAPELASLHEEKDREVLAGAVVTYENRTHTSTGEVRDVISHKAPFRDIFGEITGLIGIDIDITERKQSEDKLRESEQIFRDILRGIKAGIVVVDPQTFTIVDVNSVAENILGIKREETIGQSCHSIRWMHGKSGDLVDKCPLLEKNINNEEYRVERPDGKTVPLAKTVLSVRRSDKLLFYEIIFDISERKDLELQLALSQRLESIGALASGIAHEINTPIQYVGDNLGFLENSFTNLTSAVRTLLGQAQTDLEELDLDFILEEVPNALSQTREGIARVTEIVSAMKRFSHIGGEEKVSLDVPSAIQNTLMISRNEWKYHAEITLDLDPAVRFLQCIPGEFNQVLLNMVVNASHALAEKYKDSGEKGTITISTRREEDWLVLSVADTGCGIKEENLQRIFDPFFTTKEVGKGTGQGLALCHDIVVKRHGGTIDVKSVPGRGTTFTLRFPLL